MLAAVLPDPDFTAALAFLRRLERRIARRIEDLSYGFAVFNPELPAVWDINLIWIDGVPNGVGAADLAALADDLQGSAGLNHRRLRLAREADVLRLADGFADLGWSEDVHILQAHRRDPDRAPAAAVREIDVDVHARFSEAGLRSTPGLFTEDTIDQLARLGSVYAEAGARFFGVEAGGQIVAACDLYQDGGTAQIESVMTLEAHRNRGYAGALVLHALAEARRAGAGLVFLLAEEDDWPKALYAKLGFDQIGRVGLFTRKPETA